MRAKIRQEEARSSKLRSTIFNVDSKRKQSGGDAVLSVVPMDLYWIWRCERRREGGALGALVSQRPGWARSSGSSLVCVCRRDE